MPPQDLFRPKSSLKLSTFWRYQIFENIKTMKESHESSKLGEIPKRLIFLRPLHGGMVNKVLLAQAPEFGKIVVKISSADENPFIREFMNLKFLKNLNFPVPEPVYTGELPGDRIVNPDFIEAQVKIAESDQRKKLFILAEQYIEGSNLAQAHLNGSDSIYLQKEMAERLAELHLSKTNPFTGEPFEKYGDPFSGELHETWEEFFSKKMEIEVRNCQKNEKLPENYIQKALQIKENVKRLLKRKYSFPAPVHGDVWATNVMVSRENNKWHLKAFLDPSTVIADIEYELAYLLIFGTAGEHFLKRYSQFIPIEEGFEFRKLVYWLHTMLIHVNFFGDAHYVRFSKQLIDVIHAHL